MPNVTVTTIATHYGIEGLKLVGDTYEVDENTAGELKRNGLVSTSVKAAAPEKGEKILVSDKKEKVEAKPTKEKKEK